MQDDRRKIVRRQADRRLLEQMRHAPGSTEDREESNPRRMRRRVIRHQCQVQIRMKIRYSSGLDGEWEMTEHPIAGRMLDLSDTGCAIYTKERLEIGQELHLGIALDGRQRLDVHGAVRWAKTVEDKGGVASGVEFSGLTGDTRKQIAEFLERLDKTIGL